MQNPLVSIFVPIYNGEKYLQKTLESILNQTYTNLEILLVDDSSTDKSIQIIQNFVSKDSRVRLFVKPNGGSTAKSWNFIIPKIKGEFVFYSSQDDLFSEDLIETLVKKQNESNAECVLPVMEYFYEGKINNKRIVGLKGNIQSVITGREAFLETLDWNIHGFALRSIKLFENEFFPEDAFDSDEFMIRKMLLKSQRIAFCDGVFFYRQDNLNAITKIESSNIFFQLNTQIKLIKLLIENDFENQLILKKKYELILNYFNLKKKLKNFSFINDIEKMKVVDFLNFFRKKIDKHFFENTFCRENIPLFVKFKLVQLLLRIRWNF